MLSRQLLRMVVLVMCVFAVGVVRADDKAAPTSAPTGRLVIVKAVYGDLPDGAKTDVTAQVTKLVKDDRLSVVANNDTFGDPAEGVAKKLTVDYTIDGKAGTKSAPEDQTLAISAKPSKIVIVKALYGDLPDGEKTDVTDKVSASIDGNTLSVKASNDAFGDPAEGVTKSLKVTYTFEGKEKTKTVAEDEMLTISDSGD